MKPERDTDDRRLTGQDLRARYRGYVEGGDLAGGITEFEARIADNRRWGLAWDLLGRLREAAGDDDGAYLAYREGMEIALGSRRMSRQLKTDLVVRVVEFCHARGWAERAGKHIEIMARLAPRHPLVERLRGAEPADAMPTLARHLDRREAAQALVHEARSRYRQRSWTTARDLYHRAIAIDERCTNAYIFLARTLKNMSPADLAGGIEWYEAWIAERPNWGLGYNLLAQLYVAAGDADQAYRAFDRAAGLSDSSPTLDLGRKCELRVDLIEFCQRHGWPDREAEQRQKLADLDPEHPLVAGAVPLADPADRAGAAIARCRRHVLRDPHDRDAHVELAALYRAADDDIRAEGIGVFERVVARSPGWGLAHRLLGELREAHGDDEGAYTALREAISLGMTSTKLGDETRVHNLLELAAFCSRRGWYARSRTHIDAALALDPAHAEANAALGALDREASRAADGSRGGVD